MESSKNKLVSINILTYNSEKYIKDCLNSVLNQTYPNIEILVVDNASQDNSLKILEKFKEEIKLIKNKKNTGYTGGNNLGMKNSRGEYIILLNPDVILDKDFVKEVVKAFEKDSKIGSVQGKIYQLNKGQKTKTIDTVGFTILKSGKILDTGQGIKDEGQYSNVKEIFGVNGNAPTYRREALNDVKLKDDYFDEDFFCYGEDIDLAWRMRWRGWKAVLANNALVWHDRTSSKTANAGWTVFKQVRKSQSLWMRKISWRNQWFLFIKNQSFFNAIKFLPWFILRQTKLFLYLLFFEPKVLVCIKDIIKLLPKILKKRRIIMKNRKISNKQIGKWFKQNKKLIVNH